MLLPRTLWNTALLAVSLDVRAGSGPTRRTLPLGLAFRNRTGPTDIPF